MKKLFIFAILIILFGVVCFPITNVHSKYSNNIYADKYTVEGEFDSASKYGLEFFNVNNNCISSVGMYTDIMKKDFEGGEYKSESFLVGFGGGYTSNIYMNLFRFEICPYAQVGTSRYISNDFDEEASEGSDWEFCWQGDVEGGVIFLLGNNFELGLNCGYMYYDYDADPGLTYGATVGLAFF